MDCTLSLLPLLWSVSCDLFQLSRFQDGTIQERLLDDIENVNDSFNLGRSSAVALLPISPRCFPDDGPRSGEVERNVGWGKNERQLSKPLELLEQS
jgi:hypothetical protein